MGVSMGVSMEMPPFTKVVVMMAQCSAHTQLSRI